jgi:hypothetical protein
MKGGARTNPSGKQAMGWIIAQKNIRTGFDFTRA